MSTFHKLEGKMLICLLYTYQNSAQFFSYKIHHHSREFYSRKNRHSTQCSIFYGNLVKFRKCTNIENDVHRNLWLMQTETKVVGTCGFKRSTLCVYMPHINGENLWNWTKFLECLEDSAYLICVGFMIRTECHRQKAFSSIVCLEFGCLIFVRYRISSRVSLYIWLRISYQITSIFFFLLSVWFEHTA